MLKTTPKEIMGHDDKWSSMIISPSYPKKAFEVYKDKQNHGTMQTQVAVEHIAQVRPVSEACHGFNFLPQKTVPAEALRA